MVEQLGEVLSEEVEGQSDAPVLAPRFLRSLLEGVFHEYTAGYMEREEEVLRTSLSSQLSRIMPSMPARGSASRRLRRSSASSKAEAASLVSWEHLVTNLLADDVMEGIVTASQASLIRVRTLCLPDHGLSPAEGAARLVRLLRQVAGGQYLLVVLQMARDLLPDGGDGSGGGSGSGSSRSMRGGGGAGGRGAGGDDPAARLPLQLLEVVVAVSKAAARLQRHYLDDIIPVLRDDPNTLTITMNNKLRLDSSVEKQVVAALGSFVQAVLAGVEALLAETQKKADYRPRDDSGGGDCTRACREVTALLSAVLEAVNAAMHGDNRDSLLAVLGVRLQRCLLAHLKKFKVNISGGLVLIRDVEEYRLLISRFGSAAADRAFETLRFLVNVFMVAPEHLPQLMEPASMPEGVDVLMVKEFIRRRDDFKHHGLRSGWAREMGID
eukprot:PLAT11642.15.p1 GENE.PLAT11642.15~~PLAT11642.15.p1  ORF type:complete len:473 (+),score=233.02 PLAT11642.15:103-1419(+)